MNTIAVLLLLSCALHTAFGQAPDDSVARVQHSEALLEQIESETDNADLTDQIEWLREHPIDLNRARKKDLGSIPTITAEEVDLMWNARKKVKRFESVDELASLSERGEELVAKIRPYVCVADGKTGSDVLLTTRLVNDLQPRAGFQSNEYAGSRFKSYSRLTYRHAENLEAGVLQEKDAGETFGDGFVSGYFRMRDVGVISNVLAGDFVIEAGQGLVFWRATSFGKGSETMSIVKKNSHTIQPYRSADEFNFFRGLGATTELVLGQSILNVTGFYSYRSLSASCDSTAVSNFYEEGVFRTELEKEKRNGVTERLIGGRLELDHEDSWSVGATAYKSAFSKPLATSRSFEFSGATASVVGVDAQFHFGWLSPRLSQVSLFAELANSGPGSLSGITGAVIRVSRTASALFVVRHYATGFNSLHAAGFGEHGGVKNERGFYVGIDTRPMHSLRVTMYLDLFSFPWRTYENPLPGSGRDFLVQADAAVTAGLDLTFRYSNKRTESASTIADDLMRDVKIQTVRHQDKFRLSGMLAVNKRLRLRGRIEMTTVKTDLPRSTEHGMLLYHELQYLVSSSFRLETRLVFFGTDSYESRIYEYENDLRGVFANPALYGKGKRWYLMFGWRPGTLLDISCKYSLTQHDGVTSIGSGDSEIRNDIDNRLSLQVDLHF